MRYSCIDISQIEKKYKTGSSLCAEIDGERYIIQLAEQKTGFGSRKFFVCPKCGRRTKLLYQNGEKPFYCDKCAGINLYKAIQNGTKGGETELEYRMERFARKNKISFEYPFDYMQFAKDPRNTKTDFRQCLLILQALENMRMQNILYKTVYGPKTIKAVLNGSHPLLQEKGIEKIKKYLYRF